MSTKYYLQQYASKTLDGSIDDSQTTGITLNNTTGLDTTKPGIVAVSWSSPLSLSTVEWISYTSINGSYELVGVTRGAEGSSAKAHDNGAVVAFTLSESHVNNLATDLTTLETSLDGMHNGRIVPSVSSDDLVVALKTLAGTDATALNPITVRINNTVHTITSALSLTLADGTNWFNAGSAELATKEIDYFVYLGYNATDGVVLGLARIPYAGIYSDFSTTATDADYAGISTITNAAASDSYTVVGRLAATLSAGAGYTWTVPTYTNANLIQRPIYETRKLQYVPTITAAGSMTISSSTGTYYYIIKNNEIFIEGTYEFTTGGSAAGAVYTTQPFERPLTTSYQYVGAGAGYNKANMIYGRWYANSQDTVGWSNYAGANWTLGSGGNVSINFNYSIK